MRQNATDCTLSIFLLLFLTETGGGLTSYACSRFGKRNLQRGEEEEEEEEEAPWAIANFPHPRMVGPPPPLYGLPPPPSTAFLPSPLFYGHSPFSLKGFREIGRREKSKRGLEYKGTLFHGGAASVRAVVVRYIPFAVDLSPARFAFGIIET